MNVGRAVSYIRQDPQWLIKTLLGSIISLVPIINFASIGYGLEVLRNVYSEQETPLPEWGDRFGDRIVKGLLATVIQFIYLLPVLVLICGWVAISTAAASAGNDGGGAALATICFIPVFLVGTFLCAVLAMIALGRYAITDDFSQALRVGEVVATFRRGPGQWLSVIGILFLLGIAFAIGTVFTCGLGVLGAFYLTLAQQHLTAQALRQTSGATERTFSGV